MAEKIKRVGDLVFEEDLRAQQLRWKVQRVGWVVALILLSALLGGKEPLNSRTLGRSGSIPKQAS